MCAPLPTKFLLNESGSTIRTYNAQGRIATKTQAAETITKSITYIYNSSGQISSLTYPSGKACVGRNEFTNCDV